MTHSEMKVNKKTLSEEWTDKNDDWWLVII